MPHRFSLRPRVALAAAFFVSMAPSFQAALAQATDTKDAPAAPSAWINAELTKWQVPGDNAAKGWWTVESNELVGQSDPERKGSILWTKKDWRDFVFVCDFKMVHIEGSTVDSGVFMRTEDQQIQIGISGSLQRDMTGSLYVPGKGYPKEADGVADLLKVDGWNHMEIHAIGPKYTVWLNGQQVFAYESDKAPVSGPIGLQIHPGRDMGMRFKNIQVVGIEQNG